MSRDDFGGCMFSWANWLRRLVGMNRQTRRATRTAAAGRGVLVTFAVPQVEALEDRVTPAMSIWTGAVSDSWADPRNWAGNVAPQSEDNLVFPAGATRFTSTNDLA